MKPAKPRPPPVYVISGDEIVTIPFDLDQTVQHPDANDEFNPETAMVSVKCENCGSINVLIDEDVERTETQERHEEGMGNDTFYSANCTGDCASCGKELSVIADFSEYADGWIFSERNQNGCEMTDVLGFEDALEAFAELSRRSHSKDVISGDEE